AIISAKIISRQKHPNAEKLSICTVDTGRKKMEIVCGAPNAEENLTVPLAMIGSKIPSEKGIFEIKKTSIRGVESPGMLCSSSELGIDSLTGASEGLLILDSSVKPGMPLSEVFPGITDTIIEIDNKSITHRPDLWCHFGFAREIASIFHKKIKYSPLETKFPKANASLPAKTIHIEKGAAKAYYGMHCSGITVQPSPLWMQIRLINTGQKPINNIVDASNYTMLELGQPNHTFDAEKLKKDTVSVALSETKTLASFTTLDEVERNVPEGSILILDGKKGVPVALGGIMGGLDSGISENTSSLFLESATFPREKIRKTLSAVQLRTDSAVRFEKGQDPAKAKPALARLAELISLSCPDMKTGKITGESPEKEIQSKIKISLKEIRDRLGFSISQTETIKTLTSLNFEVKTTGRSNTAKSSKKKTAKNSEDDIVFNITAPAYRSQYDITIPEDIIEELGRIYGYDNIEPTPPPGETLTIPRHEMHSFERQIKLHLSYGGGFTETYNYSFASEEENQLFSLKGVKLKNPVQSDMDVLRVSQIPGLLKQTASNQDRFDNVRLFELGRIFMPEKNKEDLPVEKKQISIIHMPPASKEKKIHKDDFMIFQDFLNFRSYLERLMSELLNQEWSMNLCMENEVPVFLHPGCCVKFKNEDSIYGYAGILHPSFEKQFGLKRPCLAADLNLDQMYLAKEKSRKIESYHPPSVYPDSRFEFSIVMNDDESTALPLQMIREMEIQEIRDLRLLTIYRGEPLPEDKKSASYEVQCGIDTGTLPGERLQSILDSIIQQLEKAGFPLR
ncbi:MAG: phenylalanine--tRNA ligase subunit beta, partial [Spirochaetia bacterium]|nr:phenylalanine--tRNA ligase subunit beta [Spirochaetia bacterium]